MSLKIYTTYGRRSDMIWEFRWDAFRIDRQGKTTVRAEYNGSAKRKAETRIRDELENDLKNENTKFIYRRSDA